MRKNRTTAWMVIAMVFGAAGFGFGVYGMFFRHGRPNYAPQVAETITDYEIVWTITDDFAPDPQYTVKVNDVPVDGHDNVYWASGIPIVVDIRGHSPGTYNYTIVATDGYGGQVEDSVILTVTADAGAAITIDSPADVEYNYNDRYGECIFRLNETLNYPTSENGYYHEDSGVNCTIEIVFKLLDDINSRVLLETGPGNFRPLKIHGGSDIPNALEFSFLGADTDYKLYKGTTSLVLFQTYRVRIELRQDVNFDGFSKVWIDGELELITDFEQPYLYGFDTFQVCHDTYVPMILYECQIWKTV